MYRAAAEFTPHFAIYGQDAAIPIGSYGEYWLV